MIGVSTMAKAGLMALDTYGNYQTYKSSREEGHGVLRSAASVAVDAALWAVAPEIAFAKMAVELGSVAFEAVEAYGKGAGKSNARKMSSVYNRNFGGNFVDTQNASTMRQRGLQAMQQSGYNLNSVLGNEARTYYRST